VGHPAPRDLQQRHAEAEAAAELVSEGGTVHTCMQPWSLDVVLPGDQVSRGAALPDLEDRAWEESEARLLLSSHLARLPLRSRRILRLRFAQGWAQAEIAADLGVSQMHVSRLLNETLAELRQRLSDAV
jgi:RNA polymerase sigma-B factor